ncbi:MAG TPA: TM0106 family RecB-like putative nuclease [Candidatus Dormibacteraeota bacterium]|nr:TM0106 family RecB-like putative nuclease [Candidatus Dormibacteraeota bacterium]
MQDIDGVLVLSPSDLVAYTGCEHRSHLDRLVARGELERPRRDDPFIEVLRKHGNRHEARYLERLRAEVGSAVEIARPEGTLAGLRAAEAQTLGAMREGVDLIYQASFFDGRWRGHADFLRRTSMPSELGGWSYEAHDTKLARRTKAATLLQLGDYTRQVARLQGVAPRSLHVVLGDDSVESFLYADISAYLATVHGRFEDAVDRGLMATAPQPVALCEYCDWRDRCAAEWRRDDHLSLVAGIRQDQRTRLAAAGIETRTALANLAVGVEVDQVRAPVLQALREQARLQVESDAGAVEWSFVDPDPDAPHGGLASLPAPSPGDIFFDMEGDRFAGLLGREYLFGWVEGDQPEAPFRGLWAHHPAAEKAAFEGFIDMVMAGRRAHPGMHVYHYAAYEPAAMKRLMGQYATREEEVDSLLRGGVFVDLYRAVRQGVRIGVESYSLKKLEPLYMGARRGEVADAGTSIVQYELWLEDRDDAILEAIRLYNEEDCRSLVGLRGWLEQRRAELEERLGGTLPRPPLNDGAATPAVADGSAATQVLAAQLTEGIAVDPEQRTPEQQARILLASLLDWHRRDAKPTWWEYFARRDASDDELVEDPGSLGGLAFAGEAGVIDRSRLYRFTFPVQETKLKAGDSVEDPRTHEDDSGNWVTHRVGSIHHIDAARGVLLIKRGTMREPKPTALIPGGPPATGVLRDALLRVGASVRDHGVEGPGPFRAVRDLLLRRRPRILGVRDGDPLRRVEETVLEAAQRSVGDADDTCLPVQGPPGAGKTHTAAVAILDQVTAQPARRVAVTALSHRAITHLLGRVCEEARRRGVSIRVMQRSDERGCDDPQVECVGSNGMIAAALDEGTVDVVAGTAWLLARPEMAERFDTLFVDEAGQLSLANVVAIGGCARSIVLLGDPQQLEQPSAGSHPPGAEVSALGHLLGTDETVPPDRGLFLDITWRMHPDICAYISTIFYDSRLFASPDCARQTVLGDDDLSGTGLRWLAVEHTGNRSASDEEAIAVAALVARLLGRRWIDRGGVERALSASDILVVAPYNAHVAALRRRLPDDVAAGTVDRFQGQEAAVVLYSMATSLAEDVPRGIEFLYSRNRMNVAVSRARCMAVLVCSPDLLRVACTRAGQIPLANALCAFVERAIVVDQSREAAIAAMAAG